MKDFGLNDRELFPLLDEAGDSMLRRLREHPHAPRYNWRTGERLTSQGLERVRDYSRRVRTGTTPWKIGEVPEWVHAFVNAAHKDVPFYRERHDWPAANNFFDIPPITRDDIRLAPAKFISDRLPLDELVVYTTSGTSGSCLTLPATPELPNRYLPIFEHALVRVGVVIEGGQRVSILHVCNQQSTVVLCSVSSYLQGAGFAKINLHPDDWSAHDAAPRFINDCNPELITGDPFALSRLMQLSLHIKPKAIISSGTSLSSALRDQLRNHFCCPVLDVYSMNEAGPIGISSVDDAWEILQPDLFVEILDEQNRPCPANTVGRIVVTGGLNPYLPLVRYATGDHAAMDDQPRPILCSLHGRKPVAFRTTKGRWFNSIDVSTALATLPLAGFALHQRADDALRFEAFGDPNDIASAVLTLRSLFGDECKIEIIHGVPDARRAKPISFSSDRLMPTL